MPLPVYEVDVPTRNHGTGQRGLHIVTGEADSPTDAVRIAQEVYDAAVAAQQAGLEIPYKRPDGWGARAARPGWDPDWSAATANRLSGDSSWTRGSSLEA
jgi:hypothetical protein